MSLLLEAKHKEIEALKNQVRELVREQIEAAHKTELALFAADKLAELLPGSSWAQEYLERRAAL